MADDDPFADLGETLEDQDDRDQDDIATDRDDGSGDSDSSVNEATTEGNEQTPTPDPMTDTAFSYEAANQRPFYAREETINDFDAWLNYELERELSNRGYQNIVVREMTDALLRTVVEDDLVDEIAERFEEARERTRSE